MSPPPSSSLMTTKVGDVELTNGVATSETSTHAIRRTTYKNLIVLAMGFLFLFMAFQGLQNLQTSIHSDTKLGLASLCVVYASLVLSCMFVPPLLISRLGPKYTIILAMSGYVLYTFSMFYPRYGTLIPASILLGKKMIYFTRFPFCEDLCLVSCWILIKFNLMRSSKFYGL